MSWFSGLFGFNEFIGSATEYQKTKDQFEFLYNPTGELRLKSRRNEREFEAGLFETPSLLELRNNPELALDRAKTKLPGTLRVREAVEDVAQLHTLAENKFSVFQAASQFNCLEFVSENVVPENGITCYQDDKTQGPACATACAAGTVVRNYFGLHGEGQTAANQLENLRDCEALLGNATNNYFKVKGGYTLSNDEQLMRLTMALQTPGMKEEFKNKLRIGIHWDTEVTGSSFGSVPYHGPKQLVTQAYCSACSVAYSGGSKANWQAFASTVLEASYEATMYCALKNALKHDGAEGSKRVFLCAVGGGVFGNDMDWIVQAMEKALTRFQGLGLEVIIVSFRQPTPCMQRLLGEWTGGGAPAGLSASAASSAPMSSPASKCTNAGCDRTTDGTPLCCRTCGTSHGYKHDQACDTLNGRAAPPPSRTRTPPASQPASSPPYTAQAATCLCGRPTWNNQPGEMCCRSCKGSGISHGPDCEAKYTRSKVYGANPLQPNLGRTISAPVGSATGSGIPMGEQHAFCSLARDYKWDQVLRIAQATPGIVGVQPVGSNGPRWSALHQAAECGNNPANSAIAADVVQRLIRLKAPLETKTTDGRIPLDMATNDQVRSILRNAMGVQPSRQAVEPLAVTHSAPAASGQLSNPRAAHGAPKWRWVQDKNYLMAMQLSAPRNNTAMAEYLGQAKNAAEAETLAAGRHCKGLCWVVPQYHDPGWAGGVYIFTMMVDVTHLNPPSELGVHAAFLE